MQAFMKWIEDEINAMRQRKGLCAIGYDEQVRCYEILQAFHEKMGKTPNTDFNLTPASQVNKEYAAGTASPPIGSRVSQC